MQFRKPGGKPIDFREVKPMPDFNDILSLVRGPVPDKPPIAIWALPPNTAGVVGGIPDMIPAKRV